MASTKKSTSRSKTSKKPASRSKTSNKSASRSRSSKKSASRSRKGRSYEAPVFHLFPKLPHELQAMIWKITAADCKPRVVEVFITQTGVVSSPTLVPALLHACSASRCAGLRVYNKLTSNNPKMTTTVVDWEKDIIFFNDSRYSSWALGYKIRTAWTHPSTREITSNARNIAMYYKNISNYITGYFRIGRHTFDILPRLQTIKILHQLKPPQTAANIQFIPDRRWATRDYQNMSSEVSRVHGTSPQFVKAVRGTERLLKGKAKTLKWAKKGVKKLKKD